MHIEARLQLAFEYLKRGEFDQALPTPSRRAHGPQALHRRHAYGRALLARRGGEACSSLRWLGQEPGSPPLRFALSRAYTLRATEDAADSARSFRRWRRIRRAIESAESRVAPGPEGSRGTSRALRCVPQGRRELEASESWTSPRRSRPLSGSHAPGASSISKE